LDEVKSGKKWADHRLAPTKATMRGAATILCVLGILGELKMAEGISLQGTARGKRIVIAASEILDGKGGVLHDRRIVIEAGKIVAIDAKAGPVDYDLRRLTVLPGWIDAHVHITWSFGPDGKNAGQGGTTPEATYAAASNAYATLMAGFTTVQSVGSPADIPLRDAIARGELAGPRILTAAETIMGRGPETGRPEEIRAFVRKQKAAGADVIKIYASGGMRSGTMTLSQEQLNAACDEAKKLGLQHWCMRFETRCGRRRLPDARKLSTGWERRTRT